MQKKDKIEYPKVPLFLLQWFCKTEYYPDIEGDLLEIFEDRKEEIGLRNARLYLWLDVLLLFRPTIIRSITFINLQQSFNMQKHNFIISWRIIKRDKLYSIINITGLALGIAAAILIGLWVRDELTFNQYHQNYDRIAKVMRKAKGQGEIFVSDHNVSAIGNTLRNSYSNHFEKVVMARRPEQHLLSNEQKSFIQTGSFMETQAPEMFSLQMKYGSRTGLKEPNTILLSSSLSKKLFGGKNPVGESIELDKFALLKVSGVYKDLPKNSSLNQSSFIAPLDLFFSMNQLDPNAWSNSNMLVYTQLYPESDLNNVNDIIQGELLKHISEEEASRSNPELMLHPMSNWHLYNEFENGQPIASNRLKFVWFNGVIGLFILLLACINFTNLSTARSEKRVREVGVRKSIGSTRNQLVQQFLSESTLLAGLAFLLSILLVWQATPWFNVISGKEIHILWTQPWFWAICLAFTFTTGLLAGSYPAFYLSSFRPTNALKGKLASGRLSTVPRKVLVVFQFTISIAIGIGTFLIFEQIRHAKDRPIGYTQEGLIVLPKLTQDLWGKFDILSNELIQNGPVAEVAESEYSITSNRGSNTGFTWQGKDPTFNPQFNTFRVTHNYGNAVGWEVITGRDFSEEISTDANGVILNESASKLLGFDNPIGKRISFENDDFGGPDFTIIGVVKDIVKASPFEQVDPAIVFLTKNEMSWLFLRLKPNSNLDQALSEVEAIIKKVAPAAPFEYSFVEDTYKRKFESEERIGQLSYAFALMAIFISCLGLFGLATYIIARRTKEIGIRKVLGATIRDIIHLTTIDFFKLIIIALVIAIPVSWYFGQQWLNNYTYRVPIQWWVFMLAGLVTIGITFLTVGFHSIRSALANPVDSLRSE